MKRLWILSLLFVAACAGVIPPPIIVPPAPEPQPLPVHVVIHDTNERVPEHITGVIGTTEWASTCRAINYDMLNCSIPPGYDYGVTISVEFHGDGSDVFKDEMLAQPDINITLPPLKSAGSERGWLHRDGVKILTEDNTVWREKGTTAFKLLQNFCEGRDVQPWIDDQAKQGATEFRVLGMYEPYVGTFTLARDDLPRYDGCTLDLARKLASQGYRLFYTAFADAQVVLPATTDQQRFFIHVSTLLKDEWNVRGELCNECPKNGVDPSQFMKPPFRTLWSRGSGLGREDPMSPAWDLADYHEGRGDDYPRLNECRPYMEDGGSPVKGFPCLQSEPMGASEVDQPGKRAGAVNGDASQAVRDFTQMGANFGLQGPGGVFHSDAGITGDLMGAAQQGLAAAFSLGLNAFPTNAYLQTYQRGNNCGDCDGIGGMPLVQYDLPHPEGTLRTFCRPVDGLEYCVEIRRAGGVPVARGGWKIVGQPGPGLVILSR